MKRFLIFVLLSSVCFITAAYAQTKTPFSIGVGYVTDNTTAKATLADGDEVDNVFAYRGLYVGGYYNYSYFNLGLQLLIQPLHHKGKLPLGNYAPSSQILLEMPVTTPKLGFRHISYDSSGNIYSTFLIAARVGVAPSYNFSVASDYGGINQIDLKFVGFLSLDFPRLGFEVGLRKGLLDLDKHGSQSPEINEIKTKTFGFTFGLSYTF